ncbi:MAG: hypothetical protein II852_02435 [Bacteroidales bacterium]|nr:hypothetical protein [Bacteroidales bacterium]
MAKYWNLNTPEIVFVKILPEHTKPFAIQYNHSAEAIGYQKINNAIDIANYINDDIKQSKILRQKINELFERQWIDDCFSNYKETLRQNF